MKVLDQIRAEITGNRYHTPTELVKVSVDSIPLDAEGDPLMDEWNITSTFGVTVRGYKSDRNNLMKNVVEELRHAIYGDIIEQSYRIQRALMGRDMDKALMLSRDLINMVKGS